MHDLHPPPRDARPIPPLPKEAPKIVVTEDEVKRAVKNIDQGAAPGLSGLNGTILRALVEQDSCRPGLTALVQDIVNGEVTPDLRDHLLICRLIPILKSFKSNQGVFTDVEWRPVACGEAILKLAFHVIIKKLRSALKVATLPIQRASGPEGGVESAIVQMQALLELHKTWIAIKVDARNAFNTLDRSDALNELFSIKELDSLWRLAHLCYSVPSLLFLFDRGQLIDTIISQTGVRQGCVSGMHLFNIASVRL